MSVAKISRASTVSGRRGFHTGCGPFRPVRCAANDTRQAV